ncbi:MAG: thymidylate synthase [Rhodobacteraceae bacterium]|nr:thymidylate synthase [Paracoccaceae bacterium]
MSRILVLVTAAMLLASCSTDEETDAGGGAGGGGAGGGEAGGGTAGSVLDASLVPANLRVNVNAIALDYANQTLQVNISSLDTTPRLATYNRDPGLDVEGYQAYRIQEDALDRLFLALAKESNDGTVRAVTVADGGQFNRYFGGGVYERTGSFDRPLIGTGPGTGQVSYAGGYSAVTNVGVAPPDPLLLVPAPLTDPSLLPRRSARVSGDIFLNVNFADDAVNGAIYNRMIVDTSAPLATVILVAADIAANGTFAGKVEYNDVNRTVVGDYGGIFGGVSANSVAGLVHLIEFDPNLQNEQEHGVFVLTQCGPNNTLPICDDVAPF